MLVIFMVLIITAESSVIEGPSNVTSFPVLMPLPIELTCNVTGIVAWKVNGSSYLLNDLTNGRLTGHGRTGPNILVNSPVNNTEYICVSQTTDGTVDSDPAYVLIGDPDNPDMVPDVVVDDGTVNINGTIVTFTLSWGEPFNNLDPIVNYTVSCSGDVTCPANFITTDNTTRSYTITNLTTMTTYTFSVVATNSIGSGEAGVVMFTTPPAIEQVTGVVLMCKPADLTNQCTVMWNVITRGDITEYQVYYNGTMMNVNSSTTALTFTAPSLPDGVLMATIIVTVAATNRYGIGPAGYSEPAIIAASSVMSVTYSISIEQQRITLICYMVPESTADQCVVTAMDDEGGNNYNRYCSSNRYNGYGDTYKY